MWTDKALAHGPGNKCAWTKFRKLAPPIFLLQACLARASAALPFSPRTPQFDKHGGVASIGLFAKLCDLCKIPYFRVGAVDGSKSTGSCVFCRAFAVPPPCLAYSKRIFPCLTKLRCSSQLMQNAHGVRPAAYPPSVSLLHSGMCRCPIEDWQGQMPAGEVYKDEELAAERRRLCC